MEIQDINATTSTKSCVVYDKKTGDIVHSHSVIYIEGHEEPTSKEVEDAAIELACKCSDKRASELSILPVATEKLEMDVELKVDLKNKKIVEFPRK